MEDLISMMFNIDSMKSALLEMSIDVKKMPLGEISRNFLRIFRKISEIFLKISEILGKLSKAQIKGGMTVLTEIQDLIAEGGKNSRKFLDLTNR